MYEIVIVCYEISYFHSIITFNSYNLHSQIAIFHILIANSDSVGFQSLGRGVVPAKCMLRKTGAGTLLEPCWNPLAGSPGWNIFLGTNAGVDFVFLVKLFLALLNEPGCDVGSLA